MDSDDVIRGRVLSRREIVAIMGAGGAALLLGSAVPGRADTRRRSPCVVRPEMTEGPYFLDEHLDRSDIRTDPTDGIVSAGAILTLTLNVSRLTSACAPLPGAIVDLWQCDAAGVYSGVSDPLFNTVGKKFLRGYQVSDANGRVTFTTVYPGWYPQRTVHVHFKIRSPATDKASWEFTSQLFFDDAFTDKVYGRSPYRERGARTLRNTNDGIYQRGGGPDMLLDVKESGTGYATTFDVAVQQS
jgi:protocatechuate 3,4-dioxygenase beta subunit